MNINHHSLSSLQNINSKKLLKLECSVCHKSFERKRRDVRTCVARNQGVFYCSKLCMKNNRSTMVKVECKECKKNIYEKALAV
jgi:hypothetical protein